MTYLDLSVLSLISTVCSYQILSWFESLENTFFNLKRSKSVLFKILFKIDEMLKYIDIRAELRGGVWPQGGPWLQKNQDFEYQKYTFSAPNTPKI